ncbi:Nuclear pore complex protein Nup50 [Sergentomyia squamirostris]
MTTKRRNLGELNSDNWDEEDAPEEKGSFNKASEEELQRRVIKRAKRRVTPSIDTADAPTAGIFKGFSGFSKNPTTPLGSSTPFSFLSRTTSTPAVLTNTNGPQKSATDETPSVKKNSLPEKSEESEYHQKLTSLNKSLLSWIKRHIEKNPLVILTPVFNDYEKHLKEIKPESKSQNLSSPDSSKGSMFGANPAGSSAGFSLPSSTANPIGSFGTKTSTASTSPFGQSTLTATSSTGFSFGNSKPFTFGNVTKPADAGEKNEENGEEESDEPPKVTFTPVVEEDSVFSKRCKVYIKTGDGYKERGIGTLYLKSVNEGKKIQMIVRADTSLGNVLVNLLLTKGIPAQIMGKNNVMMVCIPNADMDKPVSMLLKVKNAEEADELLTAIKKHATD